MTYLPSWPARPARDERPDRPFTGYKLAHAVLSADGTQAAFAGLTLGATRVYGVVADAECVWSRRHAPPRRWCGCGFYCLHDLGDARSLACATENRSALLLEVTASGQYIRYERGLRSSRQRVRVILDAQCSCGRPGTALADAGSGLIGWRHLAPVCASCVIGRPALTLSAFTDRLDGPVRVAELLSGAPLAPGTAMMPAATVPGSAPVTVSAAGAAVDGESPLAVLSAEIALLHARLDDLQSRFDRPRLWRCCCLWRRACAPPPPRSASGSGHATCATAKCAASTPGWYSGWPGSPPGCWASAA
ncbi:MAG TPA: hypothetical protein VGM12_16170 [Trebonia sp.]|jgi:hypothetical protein